MTAGFEPNYDYVVDVKASDGSLVRATLHEGIHAPTGGVRNLAVGEVVGVLRDAKRQHVKFDISDPRLSAAPTGTASASDAFDAVASAPPRTPSIPSAGDVTNVTVSVHGSGDPAQRLTKLQALRDSGILSDSEYESARQAIIDSI
jgi:hypothetical protein